MSRTVAEQIGELTKTLVRQQGQIDQIRTDMVDRFCKELCLQAIAHDQEIETIKMVMEAPQCR